MTTAMLLATLLADIAIGAAAYSMALANRKTNDQNSLILLEMKGMHALHGSRLAMLEARVFGLTAPARPVES